MTRLWRYFADQVDEIAGSSALRLYGVALAGTHLLTAYWLWTDHRSLLIAAGREAICWPLVPDCERLRVLSVAELQIAFLMYGSAACGCALGFLRRSTAAPAYLGLAALTLFKLVVIALDFRLRRNQHYMAFAVLATFLFVPRKKESLQLLLVLFYFWAGTLKLDSEWLSGAALYRPLWLVTGRGVVLACGYVVVLELVIVWGMISRRSWIFWSSLGQVLLFHVMSWAVVGYFYPLLMFALLSVFMLVRLLPTGKGMRSVGEQIFERRLPGSAIALAVGFSLLQLATHLYPGDTAITGEGRLFSLHMFDARVECEPRVWLKLTGGKTRASRLPGGQIRAACDPITIYGQARNLCRRRNTGAMHFADFDLVLRSRHATEEEPKTVINIVDFCRNQPEYSAFLHNEWIAVQ